MQVTLLQQDNRKAKMQRLKRVKTLGATRKTTGNKTDKMDGPAGKK